MNKITSRHLRGTAHLLAGLLLAALTLHATAADVPLARTLTPADATGSESGAAVAVNDYYILVGAPTAKVADGSVGGAVDVYHSKTRAFVRRLLGTKGSLFGNAVAIAGNTAFIGSPGQSTVAFEAGAIHAYDIRTGKRLWVVEGDRVNLELGQVLAVAGDYLAVGLPDDIGPQNYVASGYVRLLDRKTGNYVGAVEPPNPNSGDKCGIALAGSGNMLAIGVPFHDSSVADQCVVLLVDVSQPGFPYYRYYGGGSGSSYGIRLALSDNYLAVATETGVRVHSLAASGWTPVKVIGSTIADWNVTISGERVFASNSVNGGQILVYDVAHDSTPFTIPAPVGTLSTSKFGRAMAAFQGTLLIGDGIVPNTYVYDLPAISWAASKMTKFLSTNASVLDVPEALISKVGPVSITTAGKVGVAADLKGSGITNANKQGVWSNMTGSADLVVRSGDAWGAVRLGTVGPVFLNATTRGLVMARFAGSNARAILEDQGSTVVEIGREGGVINGGKKLLRLHEVVQPAMTGSADRACIAGSYQTGVGGVTATNDSAIFGTGGVGALPELAREGSASPVNNTNYGQIMPRISRPGAFAAFCTTLTGTGATTADNVLLVRREIATNSLKVIARKGNNAAGVLNGKYNSFIRESANNSGSVVFRATLTGVPVTSNEGIWITSDNGTSHTLVARKGNPAAMLPTGVLFSRFLRVHQTVDGMLGILASVSGSGVNSSNDVGLWTYDPFYGLKLVAREGAMAAGAGGARYGTFHNFEMAAEKQFLLLSSLTQCSSGINLALFSGRAIEDPEVSERLPRLQLRKGSQFVRNGNPSLQSISFTRTADSAGFSGKGLGSVVALGPCAVILQFADGDSDLMTGSL